MTYTLPLILECESSWSRASWLLGRPSCCDTASKSATLTLPLCSRSNALYRSRYSENSSQLTTYRFKLENYSFHYDLRKYSFCWLFRECELNWLDEHSRSRHHRHGTHCLLTLDLGRKLDNATLYQLLNAISKPTYLLTLNWRHKRLCIRIGHYGAIQMLYYYYYYYYSLHNAG